MKAGKLEVGEAAEMKKGAWSSEEDAKLVEIVGMYGPGRWNSLAQAAGLQRTGKSCRLRWLNYLRPNVRHGGFTLDEQLLILQLYFRWGNRWAKIAEQLSGRTDNDIKNYWRTRILKHARHLNCDVNSPQFKQAIRDVWIPTLVDRITTGFGSESEARSWITQTHLPINSPQDVSGHRPTLVEQIKPGSGSGSRSESESGSCVSPAHLHLNSPQDVSGPDPYHNIVIELPSIGPHTGPGTLKPVKECGVLGPLGDTKSPDELVNGPDFDSFAFESCPSPWSASKLDFDYDLQACDYGDGEDIFDKGIEYSYLMV